MTNGMYAGDITKLERDRFNNELKLFVNRRLFDKHIISEDMYNAAKDLLMKQVG